MLATCDARIVDMGIVIYRDLRNRGTLDHVGRVTFGSDHHAKSGIVLIPREFRGFAVENGVDAGTEIGRELRQHHFGLWIAETRVELNDLRAVGGGDEAGVQNAGERRALVGHGLNGRLDDGFDGGVDHILTDLRNRL